MKILYPEAGAPALNELFAKPELCTHDAIIPGNSLRWVHHPGADQKLSQVYCFRKQFAVSRAGLFTVHLSADQRYRLYIDGTYEGLGPERGTPDHWFYDSYQLNLDAGEHVITALVWKLKFEHMPGAQMSIEHGLFLFAEGEFQEQLSTGCSPWEVKEINGIFFSPEKYTAFCGAQETYDGSKYPQGFLQGNGDGWVTAAKGGAVTSPKFAEICGEVRPRPQVVPAMLPAMQYNEIHAGKCVYAGSVEPDAELESVRINTGESDQELSTALGSLISGNGAFEVKENSFIRLIIDLEQYYCAYPRLKLAGGKGAAVSVSWAESLFVKEISDAPVVGKANPNFEKGNRSEVDGKLFRGETDTFISGGRDKEEYTTLWWRCGRYLQITVHTKDDPLTIDVFSLFETRYPLENNSGFESSDQRLQDFIPMGFRTLQMCTHETFMDCPYYEQMMYVGDTRLEALVMLLTTGDERMLKKAVLMYDLSRNSAGLTRARYPDKIRQYIPTFSLWWVCMANDLLLYGSDTGFIKDRLPGVRAVLDHFDGLLNEQGLLTAPVGWNFCDWALEWKNGIPPEGRYGISCPINLQYLHALQAAISLEASVGDQRLALRYQTKADALWGSILNGFWNAEAKCLADTLDHSVYSEWSQSLALLTGLADESEATGMLDCLLHEKQLTRMTIYACFYLYEVLGKAGLPKEITDRMGLFFSHKDMGLCTTLECPEPSRSDCHAWGAHPIFHFHSTFLGIRPAEPGFKTVRIEPAPGELTFIKAKTCHHLGMIESDLQFKGSSVCGTVTLPEGLSGVFVWEEEEVELGGGFNRITL